MAHYEEETGKLVEIWDWVDVKSIALGLDSEECDNVLREFPEFMDANDGINWTTLRACAESLYGDKCWGNESMINPVRTTNTKCRKFVEQRIPFQASNLNGCFIGQYYVVYSYKWWPLFVYHKSTNRWYRNEERYSVSTSKQEGQCQPMDTDKEIILVSHEALKEMLR